MFPEMHQALPSQAAVIEEKFLHKENKTPPKKTYIVKTLSA